MADLSDVEIALVNIIAQSLQLGDGYLAGSIATSDPAGIECRVYRGWPVASRLDADLKAGVANITVFPCPGSTRNVTRHLFEWKQTASGQTTVTAVVNGSDVTFGGTGTSSQVVGVKFGPPAAQSAYAYRVLDGDTGSSIATAMNALIPGSSVSGAVLTVPNVVNLVAIVAADIQEWIETRRQEQQFDVVIWCPTPQSRDAVTSIVDAGFSNMIDQYGRLTIQFGLPDGSDAILRYVANRTNDSPQQANLWRRDLRYRVEYATSLLETHPQVVFGQSNLVEAGVDVIIDRTH